jgi:hypothetical protein
MLRLFGGIGICCLLLAGLSGCSTVEAGPEEDLVSVSGSVTLDGTPVEGIMVSFIPTGKGSTAHHGSAVTDSDGRFEMLNYQRKEGMPPGAYIVVFSRWALPDGSAPPDDVPPATSGAVQAIPPIWCDPAKSGKHNTVNVPVDGKTDFDFTISKT